MVCLIFYYFCSETWFAILFTVITEVCQPQVKSTLIAVFLFLMNNVGGNLPVVVTSGMVASAGIEKSVLNLFALWRNMTLRHSSFFVGEQGISSFFYKQVGARQMSKRKVEEVCRRKLWPLSKACHYILLEKLEKL